MNKQERDGSIISQLRQRIRELKAENKKLKTTMELHAGDCCSLNNEVELFRGHWEDAEERCDELQKRNEALEELLVCYRLQKRPPEKLFNKLDKTKQALKDGKSRE